MAVHLTETKRTAFEAIFQFPSLQKMYALSPEDFEQFVGHVFECAGYEVEYVAHNRFPEGPGVDLNLYEKVSAKRPIARVEVRRYKQGNLLDLQAVRNFVGTLQIAGGIPGLLVTTSDFQQNAYVAAGRIPEDVRLVNGDHLLRYIAYIGGSRFADEQGRLRTPVSVAPDWLFQADNIQHRNRLVTRVLTIANNRGGIGKTTLAINLGIALAHERNHVLLVDMDGQASLTLALPPSKQDKEPKSAPVPTYERFISEFFVGRTPKLADLAYSTRFDNVRLLPANADLQRMDIGGGAHPLEELGFVRAIHTSEFEFPIDWMIIDTPPAQSFFTRAALASAHYVLVPIAVEPFAARGIARVLDSITAMRGLVGKGVNVLGCVITRWQPTQAQERERVQLIDELNARGVYLFNVKIPNDPHINSAHTSTSHGGLSNLFHRGNPAAREYIQLLQEVKERIKDVNTRSE